MAQKFEIGEKVYGLYGEMICGTVKSFKTEGFVDGSILETYDIEYINGEKKGCCTLLQSKVFNTEEEAVNELLDYLGVSKHLRF